MGHGAWVNRHFALVCVLTNHPAERARSMGQRAWSKWHGVKKQMTINMAKFRFMDMDIWKESISLNDQYLDIADQMEDDKKYRFAEQLREASLSISNNIAEGSGSYSSKTLPAS